MATPRPFLLLLATLLACGAALASPTSNEYQQCHREAAAVLQFCLDEAPGGRHGTRCWLRSRTTQQRCYKELRASHQRPAKAPPARSDTPAAPAATPAPAAPASAAR